MQNLNYYPASNSYLVNDQHTSLPTSSTFKYNTSYYGDYNSYNDSYNISPASSTSSSSSSPFSSFSSNDHNSTYSNYNHPMSYTTNANTTTTTATAYPTSNNYTAAYNSYYPMYSYYNQTTPYQSSSPYFCTQRSDSLDTPPMSNISTASSFNSSWDQNCLDTQQQQPARNIINEIDDDLEEENEVKSGVKGDVERDSNKQEAKKQRTRTQFSLEQRRYLLSVFQRISYPCKEEYDEVARSMGVSVGVLQTWFKNTRSKQKKLTHRKNLN